MATGTITVFEEAKAYMLDGGWEAADEIWAAVLDNTLAPTPADTAPDLTDYTQVGTGGIYVAGGLILESYGAMVTEAAGVMKFDSTVNPLWAQNAGNDVDAWWGLIYHKLTGIGIAMVELGGPVNMATGSLTMTWPAGGIFTIT